MPCLCYYGVPAISRIPSLCLAYIIGVPKQYQVFLHNALPMLLWCPGVPAISRIPSLCLAYIIGVPKQYQVFHHCALLMLLGSPCNIKNSITMPCLYYWGALTISGIPSQCLAYVIRESLHYQVFHHCALLILLGCLNNIRYSFTVPCLCY